MKYRQDGVDQWQWLARGKRPDAASPARSEVILNIDYINSTTAEDYTVPGSTKVSHLPTSTMGEKKKKKKESWHALNASSIAPLFGLCD